VVDPSYLVIFPHARSSQRDRLLLDRSFPVFFYAACVARFFLVFSFFIFPPRFQISSFSDTFPLFFFPRVFVFAVPSLSVEPFPCFAFSPRDSMEFCFICVLQSNVRLWC